MMRYIVVILIGIVAGYAVFETTLLVVRVRRGLAISAASRPFEANNPGALFSVLVIGDSTGVGTGATGPEDSVAGRIFRDYPRVSIENHAENGARMADIMGQLDEATKQDYHLILIQAGGNDILRWTDLSLLEQQTRSLLQASVGRARHVIFISTGNVGLAPAFFWPLTGLYTTRTRAVRSRFIAVAKGEGVTYVDLFRERREDPFLDDPARYYAKDLLHPGSEGYRVWYEELSKQAHLASLFPRNRKSPITGGALKTRDP